MDIFITPDRDDRPRLCDLGPGFVFRKIEQLSGAYMVVTYDKARGHRHNERIPVVCLSTGEIGDLPPDMPIQPMSGTFVVGFRRWDGEQVLRKMEIGGDGGAA